VNRGFYLSMMTIFAVLFLVAYLLYGVTKNDLKECRTKEMAYKALIDGDFEKFKSLMKDLPEHELGYYSSKFFDLEISLAVEEKNSGNYGKALEILEKSIKVVSTKSQLSRALLLKGEILLKMERYDEVIKELSVFLKDETLPDREKAFEILKKAAEKIGRKDITREIEEHLKNRR